MSQAFLNNIIKINTRLDTRAVQEGVFNVPFILAPHVAWVDRARAYSNQDGILQDGLDSDSPVFKMAQTVFAQRGADRVLIGRRQVDNVTVTVNNVSDAVDYTVTLTAADGTKTPYTVTSGASATATTIETALEAAINAGTNPQTATASGGSGLAIENDVPGVAFAVSTSSNLAIVEPVSSDNITDDLAATEAASDGLGGRYGLLLPEWHVPDILEAAAYIEASVPPMVFVTRAGEETAGNPESDADLGSLLKAINVAHTSVWYHPDAANGVYMDAAVMGMWFGYPPGSATVAFKELKLIPEYDLTTTEWRTLRKNAGFGKNINVMQRLKGILITYEGTMASGEYMDNIRGKHWQDDLIQVNIYRLLIRKFPGKVPYTDEGLNAIAGQIDLALTTGQRRGFISPSFLGADGETLVPGFTVSYPLASQVPANNKALRTVKDPYAFVIEAVLAGAIHQVEVGGVYTVGGAGA